MGKYGFEIFIGSQSNEQFWYDFINKVGKIDIVLDDGEHTYDQQIITTEMLLRNINDGGILVVEDTHTSYMSGFGNQKYSFINYTKKLIDHINFRFSSFSNIESEKRVWSIQIYESIVAFLINKHGTDTVSAPTDNGGKNDSSKDFRYEDHSLVKKLEIITRYLKYFPGFKLLKKYIKIFLVSSRS